MKPKKRPRPGAPADPARRKVLAQLGSLAAYTAPVMTTLLASTEARALHKPGHVANPVPNLCDRSPPPAVCDRLPPAPCEGPGKPPFCELGSLGGGPEMGAFEGDAGAWSGDEASGSWGSDY